MWVLTTSRRLLARAVVLVLLLTLLSGIFLPVYVDEIGWRFHIRSELDGVDKFLSETCGPNTLAVPPFFMRPIRILSAGLNLRFADPFFVRLSGVCLALVLAGLFVLLIRKVASSRPILESMQIAAFGLLGLGTLPLLFVWSRPEQPLLICVTGALLACSDSWRGEVTSIPTAVSRSALIVVLAIVSLSYHAKAVALTPIFALCLVVGSGSKANVAIRMACLLLLTAATVSAANYWQDRLACPDDPILAAKLAEQNVSAMLASGNDPTHVISRLLRNIDFIQYFQLASPQTNPMSAWIADNAVTARQADLWLLFVSLAWVAMWTVGIVCMAHAAIAALRCRVLNPRLLIATTLMFVAIVWSSTQTIKNVYDSTFLLPLLILSIIFAMSSANLSQRALLWLSPVLLWLGVGAVVSTLCLGISYFPSLWAASQHTAYLPGQPFSQSVFGYRSIQPQILVAARFCRIGKKGRPKSLLIDDVTYFTFMASYRPEHYTGVFGPWNGQISKPAEYLSSIGSDGAVLGCHLLDPGLRKKAHQFGPFCCLAPPW